MANGKSTLDAIIMRSTRKVIGGLGNLMFLKAFVIGQVIDGKVDDVYLQNTKYWNGHEEEIKSYFSENIGKTDKVALHIRRGDYLKADNFHVNLWETDYYRNAVRLFPKEKFIVFCKDRQSREQDVNDQEWCRHNIDSLGIDWEFAPDSDDETDDLNLMASCKAIIMANSSFSWWAAFLSTAQVVAPRKWFVDNIQRTELLLNWLLL